VIFAIRTRRHPLALLVASLSPPLIGVSVRPFPG